MENRKSTSKEEYSSCNDAELLKRFIKKRDQKAFSVIFNRYRQLLYNTAYNILRNAESAEDIVQDTFLKGFEALRKGRYDERQSLGGFLYMIARNESINMYRKKKKRRFENIDTCFFLTENADPEKIFFKTEGTELFLKELQKLERNRKVLLKDFIQGLSYEEMSKKHGMPMGTVKVRIFKGKKELAGKIGARLAYESLCQQ